MTDKLTDEELWRGIAEADKKAMGGHKTYVCKKCDARIHDQHIWVYEAFLDKCDFCGEPASYTYCAAKESIVLDEP